ncbi:MAG: DedA family protein [Candidatus Sericytochromatia bacterium]|nr:DedA family protein [Candidatus Sericytochromatia bacterium]
MFTEIIAFLAGWVKSLLEAFGYGGVVLAMAIESACIPLPSEVIMPAAGVLVAQGQMNFHLAAFAGGVGNLVGSWIAWGVGAYGGRPFLERYGRYVFMSTHDLEIADRFFARWGNAASFWGRLLPVVRTFISLPAGISRVPLLPFSVYTLLGSWIWSYLFLWIGVRLGENLEPLRHWMHRFDLIIGILLVGGAGWWIRRHVLAARPPVSSPPVG